MSDDYSILAKFLFGEMSPEERKKTENRLAEDSAFRELFEDLSSLKETDFTVKHTFDTKAAWKKTKENLSDPWAEIAKTLAETGRCSDEKLTEIWQAADSPVVFKPNTSAAWQKTAAKIRTQPAKQKVLVPRENSRRIWAIAAAVLLLIAAGIVFLNFPSEEKMKTVAALDSPKTVNLSDGSVVRLNAHSELTFPEKFSGNSREVSLKGEAFFKIAKQNGKEFKVFAGGSVTEVLGTVFHLSAEKDEKTVRLDVTEGRVAFYGAEKPDQKIIVEKNQAADFDRQNFRLSAAQINKNNSAWNSGTLAFDNTTLAEVCLVLSDLYNREIRAENGACRLTFRTENMSAESVLELISLTLEIDYETKGETIVFKDYSCVK